MPARRTVSPLHRELRLLIGALIAFLFALIVALLALVSSALRTERLAATATAARDAINPIAAQSSRFNIESRLELLIGLNGISRIEVYRGDDLFAATGSVVPSAEVITRSMTGGRMLVYVDASGVVGSRRTALLVGMLATLATITGLLILILYLPKFVRPLEEMLDAAQHLGAPQRGDDDARYLMHTFREAVERLQEQEQELDQLRDAASARTPDIHELARAIHRSFSSGFVALDAAGDIVSINDTGRGILGVPDGQAEPRSLDALPASFAEVLRTSLSTRVGATRREVRLQSGGALVGVTTMPLFDGDHFLGLFALFTDLTTFHAMEGRLRDLENLVALGQTSAGIAHEFRNSLFTILGYLRLAQRSASKETNEKIVRAETEAKRLASAVDGLLNFAKPLTIRAQAVLLDEVARSAMERMQAEAADVRFSIGGADHVEIPGDADLLELALENILRNAVDAVRQQHPEGGGTITIEVARDPHPAIVVRDNGVGLEPEAAATLLLPFQSRKSHGFGLGLPLARRIALHHGGSLSLTGAPGEGAPVTMEFFAAPVVQNVTI
jgi:signal transduction histidine kinase